MMAALMSSLSSIFNSSSTIFTMDVYTRFRPRAGETELLIAGRIFIVFLVVVSVIWIPIIQAAQGSQLFVYIQSITSFLAPPICAVYLLAVFWPRTNEPGAFWGLMGGLVIGLIRFVLEYSYQVPACGSDKERPPEWWYTLVGNIHFLNFGVILWIISGVITVIVSLLTPPIEKDYLYRLTFWSRKSAKVRLELENEDEDPELNKDNNENGKLIRQLSATNQSGTLPIWRKVVNFLCGISSDDQMEGGGGNFPKNSVEISPPSKKTKAEMAQEAADFLDEPPFWKSFVNYQAIILMTITCFMWGFYA